MSFIIGLIVTMGCMLGGFAALGGHLIVLWQPWEFVIIMGSALGTFIVAKARMRSLARDRARRRMIAAVPKATLVIANPTHYAIALRYRREEGGAPLVVAKGKDLLALRIREMATRHEVPVFEKKELVRAMYDLVDVDRMIPPEFYRPVAELIHFLHTLGARR